MKLLTLNCHSWQEKDQRDKIKYLAETIKENQYDVIALQEVSQKKFSKKVDGNIRKDNFALLLIEELEFLNEENYDYFWDYSHIGYGIYEEGLALLTKHKIVEKESFYVSKNSTKLFYKSRLIPRITIEFNNELIDFYSCHMGWWEDESEPFKIHLDNLKNKINAERQSFIMGDFNNNAYIEGEGYSYILENGFKDTFIAAKEKDEGITVEGAIAGWSGEHSLKRLDLILSTREVNVKSSKVIFNGNNKDVISDHFGVEVIIGN